MVRGQVQVRSCRQDFRAAEQGQLLVPGKVAEVGEAKFAELNDHARGLGVFRNFVVLRTEAGAVGIRFALGSGKRIDVSSACDHDGNSSRPLMGIASPGFNICRV